MGVGAKGPFLLYTKKSFYEVHTRIWNTVHARMQPLKRCASIYRATFETRCINLSVLHVHVNSLCSCGGRVNWASRKAALYLVLVSRKIGGGSDICVICERVCAWERACVGACVGVCKDTQLCMCTSINMCRCMLVVYSIHIPSAWVVFAVWHEFLCIAARYTASHCMTTQDTLQQVLMCPQIIHSASFLSFPPNLSAISACFTHSLCPAHSAGKVVLHCVAVNCSVLLSLPISSFLPTVHHCLKYSLYCAHVQSKSVLQSVAECCRVLQWVALCCSVVQCVADSCFFSSCWLLPPLLHALS